MSTEITEAFRKAMIDVLVPEIRELRVEMSDLRKEMNERFAKVDERFAKVDERFVSLQKDMHDRFAKMDERFASLKEDNNLMKSQLGRIETRLEFAERLYKLEEDVALIRKDIDSRRPRRR